LRLGCAAFTYVFDPPCEDAIRHLAELGFRGVALIAWSFKDLDEYYTNSRIETILELVDGLGLEIPEFNFKPPNLLSENRKERKAGIRLFEKAAQVASNLHARNINHPSHEIQKMEYYLALRHWQSDSVFRADIPRNLDYCTLWETYVDSIGQCTDIARKHDLKYTLEPHPFQIVQNTDGMLRLFEAIRSRSLGFTFDVGHVRQSAEIPEIAIMKMRGRIYHVHLSDNDGLFNHPHVTPGRGRVDWEGTLGALKASGYDSHLTFEIWDMPKEMFDEEHRRGQNLIREAGTRVGIRFE